MSWWERVKKLWRRDTQVVHWPSGLGLEDPLTQTYWEVVQRLPQAEAEALYCHWACRRVVDVLPEAMGREWGAVTVSDDSRVPEVVDAELRRLRARDLFVQAQKLANLYGGAGILLLVDDSQPADAPLTPGPPVRELRVVDGWHLFPVGEPLRPTHYRLLATEGPTLVHRSRVLRFDGASVPPDVMRLLDGWSDSVLRPMAAPCRAYQTALQSVAAAVRDYEILVHSISRLGDLLREPGGKEALLARARKNRQLLATFRTLFLDRDAESLEFVGRDFSGIAEAVELLRKDLQAASGLPPAVFEGQFPSGLGATGISERLQWADQIRAAQEERWTAPVERLVKLILAANGLRPQSWRWEWRPAFQLTLEEEIQLRRTQADTDATYLREGVLLPEEVAQSRFGGARYSYETVLDPQARQAREQARLGTQLTLLPDSATAPPPLALATDSATPPAAGSGAAAPPSPRSRRSRRRG